MKKKYVLVVVIVVLVAVSALVWYWDQNRYSDDDCWYHSAPYGYCNSHNKPIRHWVVRPEK